MTDSGDGETPQNRRGETDKLGLVYQSLSSETRRRVLSILNERENDTSIRAVAGNLAEYVESYRGDVQRSLKHVHLPKLERAGLVNFNREQDEVELTGNGERARQLDEYADTLFADEEVEN